MTERELRLRQRIDYLLDQREEDAAVIEKLKKVKRLAYRRCRWCGGRCWGPACELHQDIERMERELYG